MVKGSATGARLMEEKQQRMRGAGPTHRENKLRLFGQQEKDIRVVLYRDSAAWCPYCQKVWLLLEEKEIPYKIELINMRSYGDKPDWFLAKNPRGLLPVVEIDGKMISAGLSDREEADAAAIGPAAHGQGQLSHAGGGWGAYGWGGLRGRETRRKKRDRDVCEGRSEGGGQEGETVGRFARMLISLHHLGAFGRSSFEDTLNLVDPSALPLLSSSRSSPLFHLFRLPLPALLSCPALTFLAQVDEALRSSPGPWFLGGDSPSIVDLQYISVRTPALCVVTPTGDDVVW
eukprot:766765-Hanusia_phi.AAC.2